MASRFHGLVVDRLVEGARACLQGHGVPAEQVLLCRVAGAWELPLAAQAAAAREDVAGVVALGAVVRGETPHFDAIVDQAAAGLMRASMESGKPVGFGLLTCDSMEQALARAGGDHGNKGHEAAEAAWDLLATCDELRR